MPSDRQDRPGSEGTADVDLPVFLDPAVPSLSFEAWLAGSGERIHQAIHLITREQAHADGAVTAAARRWGSSPTLAEDPDTWVLTHGVGAARKDVPIGAARTDDDHRVATALLGWSPARCTDVLGPRSGTISSGPDRDDLSLDPETLRSLAELPPPSLDPTEFTRLAGDLNSGPDRRRWLIGAAGALAVVALAIPTLTSSNNGSPDENSARLIETPDSTFVANFPEPESSDRSDSGGDTGADDGVSRRPGTNSLSWQTQPFPVEQMPSEFFWFDRTIIGVTPSNQIFLMGTSGEIVVRSSTLAPLEEEGRLSVGPGVLMSTSRDDSLSIPMMSLDLERNWFQPRIPPIGLQIDSPHLSLSGSYEAAGRASGDLVVIRRLQVQLDVRALLAEAAAANSALAESLGRLGPAPAQGAQEFFNWTLRGDTLIIETSAGTTLDIDVGRLPLTVSDLNAMNPSAFGREEIFAGQADQELEEVTSLGAAWATRDLTTTDTGFAITGTDLGVPDTLVSADGLEWESSIGERTFFGTFGADNGTNELIISSLRDDPFPSTNTALLYSADGGVSWTSALTPAVDLLSASTGGGVTIVTGWDDGVLDEGNLPTDATIREGDYELTFGENGSAALVDLRTNETVLEISESDQAPPGLRFLPGALALEFFDPASGEPFVEIPFIRLQEVFERAAALERTGLRLGITSESQDSWTWALADSEFGINPASGASQIRWARAHVGPGLAVIFSDGPLGGQVHTSTFGVPVLPSSANG